ncbi:MAG: EipB family protein, partial [Hyphomicrobiales bacterium]
MTILGRCVLGTILAAAVALAGFGAPRATALTPGSELASHRAIYELKLAQTRGNSPPVSARGRILYDFSGSACEG